MGTIIVTGAASGIGAATAKLLAHQNIAVGCIDTNAAAVRLLADSLGRATAFSADIRREDDCCEAFALIAGVLGPIRAVVNCAGVFDAHSIESLESSTLEQVLSVNLIGSLNVARCGARFMDESGGSIVLFSSGTARRAFGSPAYSASKAAVEALTRECALAWAPRGIRVNAVAPGVIETPMSAVPLQDAEVQRMVLAHTPLRRLGKPQEVASVCAFLVSEAASYVTGAVIPVDGGYCIV